jgi:hypothetical protein
MKTLTIVGRGTPMETTERPEGLTDEYLDYLDDLRESGATSMFGARPWLAKAFGLDMETAGEYLQYWMRTFGERHPQA